MIYLDNAATSYPKPAQVVAAVARAMRFFGANPGRSAHPMAEKASERIFECRRALAEFFSAPDPARVVFTLNCTGALNTVIKGILKPGDHAVVSSIEHNAVMRPLEALRAKGVVYSAAQVDPLDHDRTVDAFRQAIRENTKLVIVSHASNVWGIRLPVERIAALCRFYGIPILVDAAQSAGYLPIDMARDGIDYLAVPGHKGLLGPMGTGVLIAANGQRLETILEGGTGTDSKSFLQPETLPERFESGTVNVPGICGLLEGVRFVSAYKSERIERHGIRFLQKLYEELCDRKDILLYTQKPQENGFVPVLSFNIRGLESERAAALFAREDIALRAGLHCAPAAHALFSTDTDGTIRVSPGIRSGEADLRRFLQTLSKVVKNR